MQSDDAIQRMTSELGEELRREEAGVKKTTYLTPLPEPAVDVPYLWQIRLELSYDPTVTCELALQEDTFIGREHSEETMAIFPTVDTDQLGVSRKHVTLRPTASVLYLLDLGSTNGTRLNGRRLGANIPYPITNGDMVTLGRLEFIVRIVQSPKISHHPAPAVERDLETIMPVIVRAITTQFSLKDVIKQAIEMTRVYTPADEVSVWLVDEMTGELFLEDGYGMTDQQVFHLPVANTLAGQAIKQGKPQRTNRRADGKPIKLKTGYMAEGVIYVPLSLGEMQVGVLSAVHREPGKIFTELDERIMVGITHLAAISIQNARLYQTMRQDLARRSKVVSALQYALSQDVRRQLHSVVGYSTLLQTDDSLSEETADMIESIHLAGENMLELVDRLVNMTRLSLERIMKNKPCDLVEIVGNAVETLREAASARTIKVRAQVEGKPYNIRGDAQYLFYSVYNLLENAIKFTPEGGKITVALRFSPQSIHICVTDSGPGIPEEELVDLFDRYYHSKSDDGTYGIGVGLEIVRTTVEAHMGTVSAHNLQKGGAEFVITLPASMRVDWNSDSESLK